MEPPLQMRYVKFLGSAAGNNLHVAIGNVFSEITETVTTVQRTDCMLKTDILYSCRLLFCVYL